MIRTFFVMAMPLAAALTACDSAETPTRDANAAEAMAEVETGSNDTVANPFVEANAQTTDATESIADNVTAAADEIAETATHETSADPIATQAPYVPAYVRSKADTTGSCDDGKRVCRDMESCDDAVFHLQECGMSRLDGDDDGTPCESICGN